MKHWEKKNTFIYHSSLGVYAAVPLGLDLINNIAMPGRVFGGQKKM